MDIKMPLNREDQEKENCALPIVVSRAHRRKNNKVEAEWLLITRLELAARILNENEKHVSNI